MTVTRIVQLTDLHLYADPDARFYEIPTRELFQDVVAHVEQNAGAGRPPRRHRGSHERRSGGHLRGRARHPPALARPVPGSCPGTTRTAPRCGLRSPTGSPARVPSASPSRSPRATSLCLGLDTHVPGKVSGHIGADQIAWVEAQLEAHDPATAVLFMHHPPILLGLAWLDRIGLAGREQLQDLMLRDPRIRLVCCGHVHHESSHRVGAATVVTTPSTGLQFSPTSRGGRVRAGGSRLSHHRARRRQLS